jgi:shikimate kinase
MMSPPGSIALIGFMGAGKTRIGVALAQRGSLAFVDTDALIVERFGPLAGLFAERGEAWFREEERAVCLAALAGARERPCVVALGGGAVTDGDVRAALVRSAHVAWLSAPLPVLFARASGHGHGDAADDERPLAKDETAFRRLYAEREPLYRECATVVIANDGSRPVDDVVGELLDALVTDRHATGGS